MDAAALTNWLLGALLGVVMLFAGWLYTAWKGTVEKLERRLERVEDSTKQISERTARIEGRLNGVVGSYQHD